MRKSKNALKIFAVVIISLSLIITASAADELVPLGKTAGIRLSSDGAIVIDYSKDIESPLYHIIEIVYYGRFFQRIDGFYMLVSLLVGILYISYASNVLIGTTKEVLNLKNTKPLSVLFPIIISVLSYALSEKSVNDMLNDYILNYSFVIGLILPLVLVVIIALVYRNSEKKSKRKTEK